MGFRESFSRIKSINCKGTNFSDNNKGFEEKWWVITQYWRVILQ